MLFKKVAVIVTIWSVIACLSCKSSNKDRVVAAKDTGYFKCVPDTRDFNINKGQLTGKVIKLKLRYQGIMCTCAQWASDLKTETGKYGIIFLEPADTTLVNADSLYDGGSSPNIIVEGRFYEKEGFPKEYNPTKGNPLPAKVFRYTKIKVIKYTVPERVTPPATSSTSRFQHIA